MKRFSKQVRCGNCGKTHYASPTERPRVMYAICPRCGQETQIETGRAPVVIRLGGIDEGFGPGVPDMDQRLTRTF